MATLADLDLKRSELNTAIAAYTQAVQDLAGGTATQQDVDTAKTAAQVKGDEYAKLIAQVKSDDPNVTNDDQLFSNPSRMNALVRDDVGSILTTGQYLGGAMKLLVDTEGSAAGATNVILSFAEGSDLEIDWGDDSPKQTYTGAASHDYTTPGQYEVLVTGIVNGFIAPSGDNRQQLKDVMQWGGVEFASLERMFMTRTGFVISASDKPNILPGANMDYMFTSASDFNSDISHWDVSNVVSLAGVFYQATAFNQPLNSWDVSSVVNMNGAFRRADAFNQPLNNWDVSNVTNMGWMFNHADVFNQPLDRWNTGNVTDMSSMFNRAYAFNQDLTMWDVSNATSYADFNQEGIMPSINFPNFS